MKRTAVFLDRDGTIIEDVGYIGDPEDVQLIPGAVEAIQRISRMGHLVVIVSNQSGVARGLYDEAAVTRVHARVEGLLRERNAVLDGAYYCPYLDGPEATVEAYRRKSDLRKPGPGMLLQAARELDIDLSRSWMIGDSVCDVGAGSQAGCRTILIRRADSDSSEPSPAPDHTVGSLREAVGILDGDMNTDRTDKEQTADSTHDDRVVRILGQIREQLDHVQRRQRQQDFSLLRLFGALLQMFAIVVALWGLIGLIEEQSAVATARFVLACFLQLAAICAFATDRFR